MIDMADVPRRDLSLRHSEARLLLELVLKDLRSMHGGFPYNTFEVERLTDLSERLARIVKETK